MKSGDIMTFKLVTAEEVIARVEQETPTHYYLKTPMTLSYTQQGVGMTPWLITADKDTSIEIEKTRVLATTPTMKQAADQYVQGTAGII